MKSFGLRDAQCFQGFAEQPNLTYARSARPNSFGRRITFLIRPVQTFGGRINFMSGRIQTFGGRIQTFGGQINFMIGRIKVLSGRIQTFGGRIPFMIGRIKVLSGRIQTFGGRIPFMIGRIHATGCSCRKSTRLLEAPDHANAESESEPEPESEPETEPRACLFSSGQGDLKALSGDLGGESCVLLALSGDLGGELRVAGVFLCLEGLHPSARFARSSLRVYRPEGASPRLPPRTQAMGEVRAI